MPRIKKVFLTHSQMYPHVFFIREGQKDAGQWRGFYPTEAQLEGFVGRIRHLASRGRVEIMAHAFGWIAERRDGLQGEAST